jgi:hypothetical protein
MDLFFPKIRPSNSSQAAHTQQQEEEAKSSTQVQGTPIDSDSSDSDSISSDAQTGVKNIEALTLVWSKSHLIAAYVL